jgi:transposase
VGRPEKYAEIVMTIPTQLTETQFEHFIRPQLSTAKHGYVSEVPLYKIFNYILYKLYTGCPWPALPIEKTVNGQPEMSYQVPYYHFRKWSQDGSFQRLFDAGILAIKYEVNLSVLNLDGSHSVAKKGAKASHTKAERGRKPATSSH